MFIGASRDSPYLITKRLAIMGRIKTHVVGSFVTYEMTILGESRSSIIQHHPAMT